MGRAFFLRADGIFALPSGVAPADGDYGDITVSSSGAVWTIDPGVVTYAKMQNVSATSRVLGRISPGAGVVEELTPTQLTTLINAFSSTLSGAVPLSGGGTTNFLRADGAWAVPSGGASGANPSASVGLSAVNGVAVTFLRSDGAPALSQSIVPTWTGIHKFTSTAGRAGSAVSMESNFPTLSWYELDGAANNRSWFNSVSGEQMQFGIANDADSSFNNFLTIDRTAQVVDALTYGNATDSPTHQFYGVPTVTAPNNSPSMTITSAGSLGTRLNLTSTATNGRVWSIGNNFVVGNGEFSIYDATAGAERFGITADGRVYGTALHNNAGAVTGTTNQYLASGTYTPTLTAVTNVSATSASVCQWIRVGNVVTVSGQAAFTPTGAGAVEFGCSLPIASALASANQLGGAFGIQDSSNALRLAGDATNDRATFKLVVVTTGVSLPLPFTFTYVVV